MTFHTNPRMSGEIRYPNSAPTMAPPDDSEQRRPEDADAGKEFPFNFHIKKRRIDKLCNQYDEDDGHDEDKSTLHDLIGNIPAIDAFLFYLFFVAATVHVFFIHFVHLLFR